MQLSNASERLICQGRFHRKIVRHARPLAPDANGVSPRRSARSGPYPGRCNREGEDDYRYCTLPSEGHIFERLAQDANPT